MSGPWHPTSKAVVDPRKPSAFAVCDRCGDWYNRPRLQFQKEWRGQALVSTGFLVCERCLDIPFVQNRPLLLPPDPVPIENPRYEPFIQDQNGPTPETYDQQSLDWDTINSNNDWD